MSSNLAYVLPKFLTNKKIYALAETDEDKFVGKLEQKEGGDMLKFTAEKRMGTPEELGYAIATVADERNRYLVGVDVLVDGGAITTLAKHKTGVFLFAI